MGTCSSHDYGISYCTLDYSSTSIEPNPEKLAGFNE